MIRIHNTKTGHTGRERKDFEGLNLREDDIKLQVIKEDRPEIDPNTHRVEKLPPEINLEEKTYTESWEVHELTDYEIAMRDWASPQHAIRIVADANMATTEFGIAMYVHFKSRNLPIIPQPDETVHLYCNEIKEEFQGAVDHYIATEQITIENRPAP